MKRRKVKVDEGLKGGREENQKESTMPGINKAVYKLPTIAQCNILLFLVLLWIVALDSFKIQFLQEDISV